MPSEILDLTPVNPEISNVVGGGLIVDIDGPSGTGKSTLSRVLATKENARYLDTGAMYRIATLYVLRQGISLDDTSEISDAVSALPLRVNEDPQSTQVFLGGEDVTSEIRGQEVTQSVSAVSAIPEVRTQIVQLQRSLALSSDRCIVEGRDIGTVVLPESSCKIYLDARPEVRAQRRFDQDTAAGRTADYSTVLADVIRRDHADSTRAVSPLRPAEDAHIVDTSDMTQAEVLEKLLSLVENSSHTPAVFKENTHG